jgi:hypothetical protein
MGAVAHVLPASGKPTGGPWAQESCAKQKNARKVEGSRMYCNIYALQIRPSRRFATHCIKQEINGIKMQPVVSGLQSKKNADFVIE